MNKLHLWKHVHIAAQIEMIAVLLSFLTLKKCANFILSVFLTVLHLEIIDFARNVSTTYLTVGLCCTLEVLQPGEAQPCFF